jgi:hypothetical protein
MKEKNYKQGLIENLPGTEKKPLQWIWNDDSDCFTNSKGSLLQDMLMDVQYTIWSL